MPHTTVSIASTTRRLLDLLQPERAEVGRVVFYAAIAGALSLSVPLGIQALIGLVSGGMLLQPVIVLIALVVVGTLGAGTMQVLNLGVVERMQQRLFARHALELSRDLPHTDLRRLGSIDLPEFTNRFFEIVTIQKSVAKLLTESIAALLAIVAGLLLLTLYHPYLSLFGAVLLLMLAATLWITGRNGLRTSMAESESKYRVAHWLQELARHANVFRLAGDSPLPLLRMDREVDEYLTHRQAHFRVLARQSMGVVVMKTIVTGGLLALGAALVIQRRITLGQFVAAELVIVNVLAGVEKLIFSLSTVYDALTAAEKTGQLRDLTLDPRYEIDAAPSAIDTALPAPSGVVVEATRLTYRYDGTPAPALREVTLRVDAGERIAIVGSEGAGTTTLLHVIAGLLPDYEGGLALDGESMRELSHGRIDREVALVAPHSELFDGTLEQNISLGRPGVTSGEVAKAIDMCDLREYVHSLPEGMRTEVGPGGLALPSHVVRKVLLARAVVTHPRLLLFDYFFHLLDPVAKRYLLDRLCTPEREWTIVASSHDPAFLAVCDRVLVMEAGEIVAEGTFEELQGELAVRGLLRTGLRPRTALEAGDGPTPPVLGT